MSWIITRLIRTRNTVRSRNGIARLTSWLSVFAIIVCGCAATPERVVIGQGSPKALLQYLVNNAALHPRYSIDEPVTCWIRREDIPYLVGRLDSRTPSLSVALRISSRIRTDSTEGDEALFLIEGFRAGRYPPSIASEPTEQSQREEVKRWWAEYSKERTPLPNGCPG